MVRFRFSQTCCTSPAAMWFWAVAFAVLYGVGLLMRSTWPAFEPYGDTLLLAALGAAASSTLVAIVRSTVVSPDLYSWLPRSSRS